MIRKLSLAFTIHHGSWLKAFIAIAFKTPNNIGACTISTWIANWTFISIWERRIRECHKIWRSFSLIGAHHEYSPGPPAFPGPVQGTYDHCTPLGLGCLAFVHCRGPQRIKCAMLRDPDSCACPKNLKPREGCGFLLQEQAWKLVK